MNEISEMNTNFILIKAFPKVACAILLLQLEKSKISYIVKDNFFFFFPQAVAHLVLKQACLVRDVG